MGVGDQQVRYGATIDGSQQGVDVRVFGRSRVDNRHLFVAHDVGACASKGELAGILAGHPPHQRRDLIYGPVCNVVVEIELWSCSHHLTLVRVLCMAGNHSAGW